MDTEGKKHKQFTKRRERRAVKEASADEMDGSPSRTEKDKQRAKYRRKKSGPSFEEDIIDGFAIISFKNFDDLEVSKLMMHTMYLCCLGSFIPQSTLMR